jgi:hypothetical protein
LDTLRRRAASLFAPFAGLRVLAQQAIAPWALPALLFAAALAFGFYLFSASVSSLLAHGIPDDAFYYLKIAQNFARGAGSSFDGINPTNGYHPLWFLTLAGLYRLLGPSADPQIQFYPPVYVQVVLFALCVPLL